MQPRNTETGRFALTSVETVTQIKTGHRWFPQPYIFPCGDWVIAFVWTEDAHFYKTAILRSRDEGATWNEEGFAIDSGFPVLLGGDDVGYFDSHNTLHRGGDEFVVRAVFSEDGGRTFGAPQNSIPVHCPGARVFSLAEIMRFYFTIPCYGWNRYFEANGMPMTVPGWPETAERIFFGAAGPSRHTLQLSDGRLLSMNYCGGEKPPGVDANYWFAFALESADRGRSWRQCGQVPWSPDFAGEEANFSNTGFTEAGLVELDNGELLILLRAGSGQPLGTSRSSDGGRTWSTPETVRLENTGELARGILPTVRKLADGMLVAIYGRPGVHLISDRTGTGRHWQHEIDLMAFERARCEENGAPSDFYSTENAGLIEWRPGEIGITYELIGWHEKADSDWMHHTIRMAHLHLAN